MGYDIKKTNAKNAEVSVEINGEKKVFATEKKAKEYIAGLTSDAGQKKGDDKKLNASPSKKTGKDDGK